MGVFKPLFGCGLLGSIMSMILYEMYTRGILIDEVITGTVTITEFIIVHMIIWLLVGFILAVRS